MGSIGVYVVGVFDLFHRGHIELFRKAKALGDRLVVAVNGDEITAGYKRRPIMPEEDRLELVKACAFVDYAFITNSYDHRALVLEHNVKKIVHGDDWTGDSYLQQIRLTPQFVAEHQIEMVYVPYWRATSTSEILKAVLERPHEEVSSSRIQNGIGWAAIAPNQTACLPSFFKIGTNLIDNVGDLLLRNGVDAPSVVLVSGPVFSWEIAQRVRKSLPRSVKSTHFIVPVASEGVVSELNEVCHKVG